MFCPKCSALLTEGTTVCDRCGAAIAVEQEEAVTRPEDPTRMLSINALFALFRSTMVKVLMIWEIVIAVVGAVGLLLLVLGGVTSHWLGILLLLVLLAAIVCKCFVALGARTVHRATFVEEARRGCQQIQWALYATAALSVLVMVVELLMILTAAFIAGWDGGVTNTGTAGILLLIFISVFSFAPPLLMAEVLRRCDYDLWVLSDPTVSRQYIKVGGLVTAIVVAVSAVVGFFSGDISVSSVISMIPQVIAAILSFQFYKISKAACALPEDEITTEEP